MFKKNQEVSALINGNFIIGKILAIANDDLGRAAYHVEAPDGQLGMPARWMKAEDVFVLKQEQEIKSHGLLEYMKNEAEGKNLR